MTGLETITVLFVLVLALALLIERFLEILKAVYDLLDSRLHWYRYWTRRTERLRDRLEKKLRVFEYVKPASAARILDRFRAVLLPETAQHSGTVPVLAGDLVRAVSVKTAMKVVGVGLGILLAFLADINLLGIWIEAGDNPEWISNLPPGVGMTLSGLAIGLGAGPVHKIITTIERRRERGQRQGGQA